MQPARFQFDLTHCPIGRALELLGERWTLLIVREAIYGVRRFDDFARALACGRGVLSDRLKRLCDAGVFERRDYLRLGQRPRPEYRLTEKGRDLWPIVNAMRQWGDRWAAPGGPPLQIRHKACGAIVEARPVCSHCGEPLDARAVLAVPGPGAAQDDGSRGRPALPSQLPTQASRI